jgi:SIR2-like domain
MTENDWLILLRRIRGGNCTPFLGAAAAAGTLPLGADIAKRWASEHDYPLDDTHDLARIAQFLGVSMGDAMYPKEQIVAELEGLGPPDFDRADEPHSILASLPLPVYLTTNYDSFMYQALKRHNEKNPREEFCRWNRHPELTSKPTVLDPSFLPTVKEPIVYHLHGSLRTPESIVLTEDDYLDFLVAVSRDPDLLPHQIKKALAGASLLFVGYRLADWDFRVLHRGLVISGEQSLRRLSVTVQLPPTEREQAYLEQYFKAMDVRVYWGEATAFIAELKQRWEAFERVENERRQVQPVG